MTTIKSISYYIVKTLSILLVTCLILVSLFFGYIYVCNLVKMDVPALGPFKIYLVLSDSMAPTMVTDDGVIISETAPENLQVGDIITFNAFESDTIITHRITDAMETEQGYEFKTKGDNNNVGDSFTTPGDRVIGKYVFKISQFGALLNVITERPYIIAVAVALVIIVQLLFGLLEKALKPEKIETEIKTEKTEKTIPDVEPDNFIAGADNSNIKQEYSTVEANKAPDLEPEQGSGNHEK